MEELGLLSHMKLSKGEKAARTRKKNQLKRQLEQQLKDTNIRGPIWEDRIESYLNYWEIEQDLIRDIQIRGPNIQWNNGGGQSGVKKNDSLVQLPKISKEMRDLLAFFDIKIVEPPDDGEGGVEHDSNV